MGGNVEPAFTLQRILEQLQQGISTTTGGGTQNVIIVAAIPAGDNNIGNVDVLTLPALPAGTNNIGDFDALSVIPGTGATNLGKAEDAPHTTGDVGVMNLTVRTDTPAPLGANGDYVPQITDSTNLTWMREGYQPAYEDNPNAKAVVEHRYTYGRATADTQIKATAGLVHAVNIAPTGTVTAGVITIYDSAAESGTVIYSCALPITSFTPFLVTLDAVFATGLYVGFDGTLANVQATVSYR